jgi:hypothetical protein
MISDDIIVLSDLREKLLSLGPEERRIMFYLIRHIFNRITILKSIESRYRKRFLMNVNYSNNLIEINVRKLRIKKGAPNAIKIFNNKIFFVIDDKEYEHKIRTLFDLYVLGLLIRSSPLKYKEIIYMKIDFPKDALVIT